METGDIIVVCNEQQHDRFVRDGDHLISTMKIGFTESLCGFKKTLNHLDGTWSAWNGKKM